MSRYNLVLEDETAYDSEGLWSVTQ